VKITPDVSDDKHGRPVVNLSLGNAPKRRHYEIAWIEMPLGMARDLARQLSEAADEAERDCAKT
jgi:hypothetical protein